MLKEIITPKFRSHYNTDADYNRARFERATLVGFVLSVIETLRI